MGIALHHVLSEVQEVSDPEYTIKKIMGGALFIGRRMVAYIDFTIQSLDGLKEIYHPGAYRCYLHLAEICLGHLLIISNFYDLKIIMTAAFFVEHATIAANVLCRMVGTIHSIWLTHTIMDIQNYTARERDIEKSQ